MEVSQKPFQPTTFEVKTEPGCDLETVKCFPCSICNECLKGKQYFDWNYRKFCWKCFVRLYGEKCVFCQKSIYGTSTLIFTCYYNKTWHRDCFKCRTCEKSLQKYGFVNHEDKYIGCSYCGTHVKFQTTLLNK